MLKTMQSKVTDHTLAVYGKKMPASVTAGKNAVLHVLAAQADKVESVVFLEKSPQISKLQLNQLLAVQKNIIFDHDQSVKFTSTFIPPTTLFSQ